MPGESLGTEGAESSLCGMEGGRQPAQPLAATSPAHRWRIGDISPPNAGHAPARTLGHVLAFASAPTGQPASFLEFPVSDPKPIAILRSAPRAVAAVFAAARLTVANTARADVDPVVMFDGFDGCAPVQGEIGPAGGVLRLCGAQLTIPPDAVVEPTVFGIERLDESGEAPFDMEFAGPAFRFTPLDPGLQQQASVRVPRADARHGRLAYFFPDDAQYILIEACQVSAGGIQQFSGL